MLRGRHPVAKFVLLLVCGTIAGVLSISQIGCSPGKEEARSQSWRAFEEELAEVRKGTRKRIVFYESYDTDKKMRELAETGEIEHVFVQWGEFTDNGMRYLATMPGLKSFAYSGGRISEEGIRYLEGNPTIERLDLDTGPMRSEVASVFASMPNLKSLTLYASRGNDTVDRAFAHTWMTRLSELTQLETLKVGGQYVDDEEVEDLRRRLENTKVEVSRVSPL